MSKQKISITIDEELIGLIEDIVKSGRFRNRSHVLEFALSGLMGKERSVA